MVLTLKPVEGTTRRKKKARICVCGNYQKQIGPEQLYTANSDIASIRLVLAMAAQDKRMGITTLDVETAFLNTPMPKDEPVYAKPPNLLVQYNLLAKD